LVTKASKLPPLKDVSKARAVVGKFVDDVWPATYALPPESTAMAWPESPLLLPPRYVA
jgi:hypothetical protein